MDDEDGDAGMFVVSIAGLVHAMVELTVPELRGAVHPLITVALLGAPFVLPMVAATDAVAMVAGAITGAVITTAAGTIAMCSADDANGRACERVHKHCDGTTGTPSDAGAPMP